MNECSNCKGEKKLLCYYCQGNTEKPCPACGGDKTVACGNCRGSGRSGGFLGLHKKPCLHCGSQGRVRCDKCGGAGKAYCYKCTKGMILCQTCRGTGEGVNPEIKERILKMVEPLKWEPGPSAAENLKKAETALHTQLAALHLDAQMLLDDLSDEDRRRYLVALDAFLDEEKLTRSRFLAEELKKIFEKPRKRKRAN